MQKHAKHIILRMLGKYGIAALLVLVMLLAAGAVSGSSPFIHTASATSLEEIEAVANASSNPLATYREQQQKLMEEMDELESLISVQNNLIAGLESEIAAIDAKLLIANQNLANARAAMDAEEALILELEAAIEEAQVRLEERLAYLEERLVNLYVYGDISILDVIFETESFNDFLVLFDMVELIMEHDRHLADEIIAEQEAIKADKAACEAYLAELEELEHAYVDAAAELKTLEEQKGAALAEEQMTRAEYEAYHASMEETANALSQTIRDLLAQSDSTLSYGGSMIWPLPSSWTYVTSEFGWRTHPVYGDSRFHTGIDVAANGGVPIYAAADGKVIMREYYGGYGYCIMLEHGSGIVSLYAHQSAFGAFNVGDYVVAGDCIGYVGTTGTSTGNHLHFEVRQNGEAVSPWNYLR